MPLAIVRLELLAAYSSPDAVLYMETALFYYRHSDRNPAEWNIAIDKNVSKDHTKIDYPFLSQQDGVGFALTWRDNGLNRFN